MNHTAVGVIMGSTSDWDVMRHAGFTLDSLLITFEAKVVSAHRTPDLLFSYAESAQARGIEVIIAGAGGAAHLPGMCAAKAMIPVIGVPIDGGPLRGLDALLSIAQMPAGVPVAAMAVGVPGAVNAALFAAAILAGRHPAVGQSLLRWRKAQAKEVLDRPDPRSA